MGQENSKGMEEAILNFGKQFDYVPDVKNKTGLGKFKHVVVLGMGGSHLAADIAKNINPSLDLIVHSDYGLPDLTSAVLKDTLFIASSYSGNTEEVIDGITLALSQNYQCAVISVGGKLIEFAKSKILPYVELPDTKIQPRCALGFAMVALAHLIWDEKLISEIALIKGKLMPEQIREEGMKIAGEIKDRMPVIYSSRKNLALAYNWKIKFNETGKLPAFFNVIPEMNHNEMTGFDFVEKTKYLSEKFAAIFLFDTSDIPQIQKRMAVSQKLYEDRKIKSLKVFVSGSSCAEKTFKSLILADWVAYYTAVSNGADPEKVPMVEEFKRAVAGERII